MGHKIKVGVVGRSAPFIRGFKSDDRVQVEAVCRRSEEMAAGIASKWDIPRVYTDFSRMVESGSLDAVAISTPDDLHLPMTLAAIDAGLHVLCDKPLALDASGARQMLDAAQRAQVCHMTYYNGRSLPLARHLADLVKSGYAGKHLYSEYVARRSASYGYLLSTFRGEAGRWMGPIADEGSHMLDLALWLAGDIRRVSAHATPHDVPTGISASLYLEFADSSTGLVHLYVVDGSGFKGYQSAGFFGDEGSLEVRPQEMAMLYSTKSGDHVQQPLATPKKFAEMGPPEREFVDAIVQQRPASPSFLQGYRVQCVIDAALRSVDLGGSWVEVEAAGGEVKSAM